MMIDDDDNGDDDDDNGDDYDDVCGIKSIQTASTSLLST